MSDILKECAICGKEFHAWTPGQKYCSKECHDEAARRRFIRHNEERRKMRLLGKDISRTGHRIDAKAKEAAKRHISYGKLQAERYQEELRTRGEAGR